VASHPVRHLELLATPEEKLLTNSRLTTFRRCSLEHHLAYEEAIRPLGGAPDALRFGSLFHIGLAGWWLAFEHPGEQLDAAIEAMRPLAMDEFDMARAECLMRGYDARWAGAEDIEVLAVERQFETELRNPLSGAPSRTYRLAGKLDLIVLNRGDGLVYIGEHKTSSEDIGPGTPYWEKLRIDAQVSTYFAGARSLGYEPAGCLYDVIGKSRHAPLLATPEENRKYTKAGALYAKQRAEDETAEEYGLRLAEVICAAPDKFYRRGFVVRLPEEEREAAFDAWQTARLMREAKSAGIYPRNVNACERYGRMCGYFPVCTRAASLDDSTMFERVASIHPELQPAEAGAAE
jgi:hypothetical protein